MVTAILALTGFLPLPAVADGLAAALNTAVGSGRSKVPRLAVHVVDPTSEATVYDWRADDRLIVASNAKLLTTAVALEELGPGYLFDTPLMVRGVVTDGRLEGDLAVVGSGDPNLSGRAFEGDPLAVFRSWGRALLALGIHEFQGEVFLVHGLFDDQRVHPDWPRDQLGRWYEAPVAALSFSDNCVLVRVVPAAEAGRPATVQLLPDLELFEVEGTVTTTSSARHHGVGVSRKPGGNTIRVSGAVLRTADPVEVWVAVDDPVRYFGAALVAGLESAGLEMTERLRPVEALPEGRWRRVTGYRSDLLSTLEVTNRRSQNFYAESLLKTMAARRCGEGTWDSGRRLLIDYLERIGIAEDVSVADGSGMSRNNRLAPRQLTRLLTHMYRHEWRREYLMTLPYSGWQEHRRWRTRLAAPPYRGNVVAKTGTLRGVSTLSGYAKARSGKTYVFSILCNGLRSVRDGRRIQDRIVRALIDRG